jgi:hypothetical protein
VSNNSMPRKQGITRLDESAGPQPTQSAVGRTTRPRRAQFHRPLDGAVRFLQPPGHRQGRRKGPPSRRKVRIVVLLYRPRAPSKHGRRFGVVRVERLLGSEEAAGPSLGNGSALMSLAGERAHACRLSLRKSLKMPCEGHPCAIDRASPDWVTRGTQARAIAAGLGARKIVRSVETRGGTRWFGAASLSSR